MSAQQPSEAEMKAYAKAQLEQACMALRSEVAKLENDYNEHDRVIEALNNLEGERVAYHIVGEALAKSTVGNVAPRLVNKREQIKQVLQMQREALEKREKELETMQ